MRDMWILPLKFFWPGGAVFAVRPDRANQTSFSCRFKRYDGSLHGTA